jgi:predicted Rossmann-fold nucleotide-binding protein
MKFESLKGRLIVGVIGEREASRENYLLALSLGKELAQKGAILITGGLGGVMEAASRGAKEEGGITLGILPGDNPEEALKDAESKGHKDAVILYIPERGIIHIYSLDSKMAFRS